MTQFFIRTLTASLFSHALCFGGVLLFSCALLFSSAVQADPKIVNWEDLMPPEDLRALEEYAATQDINHDLPAAQQKLPEVYQSKNVVKTLDKQHIKLPGYIVPLSYDAKGMITEFFLVPYFGACIHMPPPPPNQIVLVKTAQVINPDDIWQPFWVEGEMHLQATKNDLAESSYALTASKITVYEEPAP